MSKFLLLFVLIFLAIVIATVLKRFKPGRRDLPQKWPIYAKKALTQPEQILYQRLIRAFPNQVVLAQVALPAFLGVQKGNDFRAWYNRFGRLYADFVLCEKDFRVAAVIELDDGSHDHPKRQDADGRKAAALAAAGIPLHRLNVNPLPNEEDLLRLLAEPERKQ